MHPARGEVSVTRVIITLTLVLALLTSLMTVNVTSVSAESNISIQVSGNNISVKATVPSNVSHGILITVVFKVMNATSPYGVTKTQEILRFNAVYVTGGDIILSNVTDLPPGRYVIKVMLWNDMLAELSAKSGSWLPIMYAEMNATIG